MIRKTHLKKKSILVFLCRFKTHALLLVQHGTQLWISFFVENLFLFYFCYFSFLKDKHTLVDNPALFIRFFFSISCVMLAPLLRFSYRASHIPSSLLLWSLLSFYFLLVNVWVQLNCDRSGQIDETRPGDDDHILMFPCCLYYCLFLIKHSFSLFFLLLLLFLSV